METSQAFRAAIIKTKQQKIWKLGWSTNKSGCLS